MHASRTILHLDMDAFFAAVEQRDNPGLQGRAVIVGGLSDRAVVTTASYEARRYGVRSAMPMFQARRKCPQAIIVAPRRERYQEVSRTVMGLLREFTPLVEPVSIDEAYLDVTGCERLFGPPPLLAERIKTRIRETVALTCSIGIAPNRFLAKIASDMDKPDGLTRIAAGEVLAFTEKLLVGKVPGVGPMTLETLRRLGIRTLGELRKFPDGLLERRLGRFGRRLKSLAFGVDPTPVVPVSPAKSVSSEETLAADTADQALLKNLLLLQAETVGAQLRKMGLRAKTITLKLKYADFSQITRSVTLPGATQAADTIFGTAVNLLQAQPLARKVRLIGVGASHFLPQSAPSQRMLFDGAAERNAGWEKVDRTVDAISRKFGRGKIRKASL
ncbi:MAG: DNA polymerase IV [Desulfobacteraceae bacterium]|jgi:DNA polymerase-4|nr:DNA polymerase IV [Desulfobacteraceae bacterium]